MAYRSRSSSGRRGGPPARSNGNPAAMAIAIVVVLGGLGAVVFFMASKKDKPPPKPPPAPVVPVTPPKPPVVKPPDPPPYPPLSADRIAAVRAEVKELKLDETAKKVQVLYDEAMIAKGKGDEATWQAKLREAAKLLETINDQWNEIVATMPSSKDYNEDEVANHYVGDEATQVNKALGLLPGIKKQIRMN
jgi:hypothetical protein